MKKVGIVTFYSIYNYGSVLQAYGLINAVEQLGYRAKLVDYNNMKMKHNLMMKLLTYKNRLFSLIVNPKLIYHVLKGKFVGKRSITSRSEDLKRKFDAFIAEKLNLSDKDYRKSHDDEFSAFICGSDQIWQLTAPGLHEMFFLRFTHQNKRIAYAPSFGGVTIPKYNQVRLKRYLSEIPYLSAREDSGVKVIKESIGIDAPHVLDPVLLVGKDFWLDRMEKSEFTQKNYLVCYFMSDASHAFETIEKLSKDFGLEIIWITSGKPLTKRDFTQYDATPLEFVSIVKNAKFVCTDSLHGAEFSILLETPFYIFQRNYEVVPEQHTRIDSLLRLTNMEDRLISVRTSINYGKAMQIDFSKSNMLLERARKDSMEFLKVSLERTISIDKKRKKR